MVRRAFRPRREGLDAPLMVMPQATRRSATTEISECRATSLHGVHPLITSAASVPPGVCDIHAAGSESLAPTR